MHILCGHIFGDLENCIVKIREVGISKDGCITVYILFLGKMSSVGSHENASRTLFLPHLYQLKRKKGDFCISPAQSPSLHCCPLSRYDGAVAAITHTLWPLAHCRYAIPVNYRCVASLSRGAEVVFILFLFLIKKHNPHVCEEALLRPPPARSLTFSCHFFNSEAMIANLDEGFTSPW